MAKQKTVTPNPEQTEETVMPETKTETVAIEKAPAATTAMSLLQSYEHVPEFVERYGKQLIRIEKENVTGELIDDTLWKLPEEIQDKLFALVSKMNPQKKGVVASGAVTEFLEMRVNQGTGNDPNRPEDSIPGHFYISSSEKMGKEFLATPILLWEGCQKWEKRDASDTKPAIPECTSHDRIVGDKYGHCEKCLYLPWRDNKPNECSNTVSAILLTKDPMNIVMMRFQRTSTPGGTQLVKLARRGSVPWARWYKFATEKQEKVDKRWYVITATPVDEKVDPSLQKFCDLMCTVAERDYLYPKLARNYAQEPEPTPAALTSGPASTEMSDADLGDFGGVNV
jgi:hypothetical protein